MNIVHGLAMQLTQIGSKVQQIILIIDLKGIKIKTFSNKIVNSSIKKVIAIVTQYFPEILYKGFIVNAPMAFSQYWSTLGSLIPAETLSKFKVTGSSTDAEISLIVFMVHLSYRFLIQFFQNQWVGYGEQPVLYYIRLKTLMRMKK